MFLSNFIGPRYRKPKVPKVKGESEEKRPRTAFSMDQLARLKVIVVFISTSLYANKTTYISVGFVYSFSTTNMYHQNKIFGWNNIEWWLILMDLFSCFVLFFSPSFFFCIWFYSENSMKIAIWPNDDDNNLAPSLDWMRLKLKFGSRTKEPKLRNRPAKRTHWRCN